MTIDQVIDAIKGSERAVATQTHQLNKAAVDSFEALGYVNGRLDFDRFNPGRDGAQVVAAAANNYLNGILNGRLQRAPGAGALAPDEEARLQMGYFGMTSQDIATTVEEMKERFSPEALKKKYEKQIAFSRNAIFQAPIALAQDPLITRDAVLARVGLGPGTPLNANVDVDKVNAPQYVQLLSEYVQEQAITKDTLKQFGLYRS